MKVAVPVISTNEAKWLRQALESVRAQGQDAEPVVFDNASTDETEAIATELNVRCVRLSQREPYSRVMNQALEQTDGELVLMMQPDCFLGPGFLRSAIRHFADPTVGSVAPKLIRAEGPSPAQQLAQIDAAGMVVDRRRKNGLAGHGARAAAFGVPAEAFGADGAAALYRREALADVAIDGQVFDEELVWWHDGVPADWGCDADLAWRARVLGWRCVYDPAAVAYHVRRYSPSTRWRITEWQRTVQFRNRYLMIVKNDPLRTLLRDLPVIGAYELAALGFVLFREPFLLRGYRQAASLLGSMRRKRAEIQRRRRERGIRSMPYGLAPPR